MGALRIDEEALAPIMIMEDLRKTDTVFSVPIFFIQGENNVFAPASLVSEYISKMRTSALIQPVSCFVFDDQWSKREYIKAFRI
jgi:hypothetical protein